MVTTRISTEDSINMCGCFLGIQLPANLYLDTLQCFGIKKNHFNAFILQECLNIHCCHHAMHILHSVIASAAIWKQFPLVVVLVGFVSLLSKELKQLAFCGVMPFALSTRKVVHGNHFFFIIFIPAGSGASGHSASWGRTTQPTSPPYESHLHSLVSNITVFIQIKH